ncbi:hypothetical protein As57867_022569, partial [Aphanomyces stellatus]
STGQYFKIKNSWGAQWGENGYIYLQRGVGGKGMCNVAEGVSYPQLSGSPQPPSPPSPSSSRPSPSSNRPSPSSNSPTRKPQPQPSSRKPTPSSNPSPGPSGDCGSCTNCYYAPSQSCFAGWTKSQCTSVSQYKWCGKA